MLTSALINLKIKDKEKDGFLLTRGVKSGCSARLGLAQRAKL